MKKWELLKRAYDNYPKGTRFKSVTGVENISTGKFTIGSDNIVMDGEGSGRLILGSGFEIWAEVISDKTPLIISEDKVLLFEGDEFYLADYCHDQKWKLTTFGGNAFKIDDETPIQTELMKYFSTKEAALAWIEAQQPKEITIELNNGRQATIFKVGQVNFEAPRSFLIDKDIEEISNALKTLSK